MPLQGADSRQLTAKNPKPFFDEASMKIRENVILKMTFLMQKRVQ